jgi:hypothetical protein
MTKRMMRVPTPSPPLVTPGGIALSDSEKAETLADNLETHFQPVTDPSAPAFLEMVEVALRSYFLTPPPPGAATSPKRLKKVADLQFSNVPVWVQIPDSQPTKVYSSHN